jgi:hypothetical protein
MGSLLSMGQPPTLASYEGTFCLFMMGSGARASSYLGSLPSYCWLYWRRPERPIIRPRARSGSDRDTVSTAHGGSDPAASHSYLMSTLRAFS